MIESFNGGDYMHSVNSTGARIGENGNKNVFLDIKRTWIKCELPSGTLKERARGESFSHEVAEGHHSDLGGDG